MLILIKTLSLTTLINNAKKQRLAIVAFLVLLFKDKDLYAYKAHYLLPITGGIYSALLIKAKG